MDGAVAEHYGIQAVPQAFLVAKDGTLIRHSLQASQLEAEVATLIAALQTLKDRLDRLESVGDRLESGA